MHLLYIIIFQLTPSTGQNISPLEEPHTCPEVMTQTSPTAASTVMQPDVSDKGNIAGVPQHVGRNTSASTAEGNPISSPVADKDHAGNKAKHHKLSQREVRMCMWCMLGLYTMQTQCLIYSFHPILITIMHVIILHTAYIE